MPVIELKITAETPLHLGQGSESGGVLRFARDSRGRALISAPTIKGIHRIACERVARTLGLKVCVAPDPSQMCQPTENNPACVICRIFGSRWLPGLLRYADLTSTATPVIETRSFAPQSRRRRKQIGYEALSVEVLPAGTTFMGKIDHFINDPALLGLAVLGLRSISAIGVGNAIGYGLCRVEAKAFDVMKRPADDAELAAALRRLAQP